MPTDGKLAQLHRVLNLYFILRERAKGGGSLLTYGDGAKMVGIDNAQFCLGPHSDIEVLAAWIKCKDLPPLWILLRNKGDMLPGRGSTSVTRDKLGEEHARVAVCHWDREPPPTIEELVTARDSLRPAQGRSN